MVVECTCGEIKPNCSISMQLQHVICVCIFLEEYATHHFTTSYSSDISDDMLLIFIITVTQQVFVTSFKGLYTITWKAQHRMKVLKVLYSAALCFGKQNAKPDMLTGKNNKT